MLQWDNFTILLKWLTECYIHRYKWAILQMNVQWADVVPSAWIAFWQTVRNSHDVLCYLHYCLFCVSNLFKMITLNTGLVNVSKSEYFILSDCWKILMLWLHPVKLGYELDQALLFLLGGERWFQILFYKVTLDTKNYANNLDKKNAGWMVKYSQSFQLCTITNITERAIVHATLHEIKYECNSEWWLGKNEEQAIMTCLKIISWHVPGENV